MQNVRNNTHWVFWIIVLLGLLWNAGGVMNYMMQMKPNFNAAMPDIHQAIVEGRPAWATAGFAVGVFGGLIGCLLLLIRRSTAGIVFMISLIGIFVTTIHTLNVILTRDNFTVSDIFLMVILPIVVANFLIGFTFYAMKKGWIATQ